ncbi:MAG TPA: M28 family metallopeptidase [Parafilimonas sp.]|nr:M28 family metallopeptidase [Parafilimonas sp.]
MKRLITLTVFIFILLNIISGRIYAQTIVHRDAEIENILNDVSKDSLQSYIHQLVNFNTRSTLSSQTDKIKGIGAARNWVLNKFKLYAQQSNGRMNAYVDTTTLYADGKRLNRNILLGNVIAILRGTDTADKRIFLMSGHLDSRRTDVMDSVNFAPGANDDASGVAAVIEAARVLSSHKFPATIILMAVSGEEQGLFGSEFMADKAAKNNLQIEAVLNNDIIGSNNSSGTNIVNNTQLRVFSEAFSVLDTGRTLQRIRSLGLENDGKSRQLARYVKEIGERYVDNLEIVMVYRSDRFLRGGDHIPFAEKGFAAVRLTEMNENFNHQHQNIRTENGIAYGDLEEYMDFDYLKKNAQVNIACLANLAKSPSAPQNVSVDVKDLTNFTTISWLKPQHGNVKGYYVLMRETTSAVWQKKTFTKDTSINLPYSKDNYFFAVQSVSDDGNESLPVMPFPSR